MDTNSDRSIQGMNAAEEYLSARS